MVPYVLSQDVPILLRRWGRESGRLIPETGWVANEVGNCLRRFFPAVEVVSGCELENGIFQLVNDTGIVPVSFDRVYFNTRHHIDTTRFVSVTGDDLGQGPRPPCTLSLQEQLACLVAKLLQTGEKEVVLVDDVIFSGGLFASVVETLRQAGIRVPVAVAGIAIGEGINRLRRLGVDVRSERTYSQVVDEVCERDFVPGVPLSGRSVFGTGRMCAPYIQPFGHPGKWASIPTEGERSFSRFCLEISANLFETVQTVSGQPVFPADMERVPLGLNDRDPLPCQLRRMAATL